MTVYAALLAVGVDIATAPGPVPEVVSIPAGPFIAGSDAAEREYAYHIDAAAYGRPVTREQAWYEGERARGLAETGAYFITVTPI